MGKKKKERDEEPPEYATENEKKKTRSAAYNQLSTETLLIKEQECTQDLVKIQSTLDQMRTKIDMHYRSDALRQMNTKRYRSEYALGEIRAEIERRARRKLGVDMPKEGIQGGSAAGVAATMTANTLLQQERDTKKACTSVLAEQLMREKDRQSSGAGQAQSSGSRAALEAEWRQAASASSSGQARLAAADSGPGSAATMHAAMMAPAVKESTPAITHNQLDRMAAMSSMNGMGAMGGQADMSAMAMMPQMMQAMSMMHAMNGGSMAPPTAEEMAAAANAFRNGAAMAQQMQSGMMQQMGGMMQSGMMQQASPPQAAPNTTAAPPSNVPAGIARKFRKQA